MILLAADPGVSGAIAVFDGRDLRVIDMPVVQRESGGNLRRYIDEHVMVKTMMREAMFGAEDIFVEQVGGMPGQSASRAFNFGWGYGALRTAAIAADLALHAVPPGVWKRAMRAPADKGAAIGRANELFPTFAHLWAKGTGSNEQRSGRAEAAMLALYGERVLKGLGNV